MGYIFTIWIIGLPGEVSWNALIIDRSLSHLGNDADKAAARVQQKVTARIEAQELERELMRQEDEAGEMAAELGLAVQAILWNSVQQVKGPANAGRLSFVESCRTAADPRPRFIRFWFNGFYGGPPIAVEHAESSRRSGWRSPRRTPRRGSAPLCASRRTAMGYRRARLLARRHKRVYSMAKDSDVSGAPGGRPRTMAQAQPTRRIRVIGVPLDLGASRRGVDMGPSAIRVAGLEARLEALGHQVTDGGDIRVEIAETRAHGDKNAHYLAEIAETCTRTAEAVVAALEQGVTPLLLGGDHSLAAGSVSGVAEFYRRREQKIGVLWIDAHCDINTPETTPSGNVHGMPLAALLGLGPAALANIFGYAPKIAPENTALIGVRDIDAAERENLRRAGMTEVSTMRDIDERGMRAVMEEALRAAGRGTAGYHVSLDMDWIDPEDAPGVGTPVRGGATYREAHLAMEIIADYGRLLSLEIVEVNPVIDEHNRTADLAAGLACSAFGKKIL